MHLIVVMILHGIVYGAIFHPMRHLTPLELPILGIFAAVAMLAWPRARNRRWPPGRRG